MSKPSVILMGSKPGAVVALRLMLDRGWDVRYVVVSRKITHSWFQGPTLEELALQRGLQVVTQPELPRDVEVDFVISYMFRYRVKSDVIALANRAAVNFHAGPLPEFGGWAFYSVAILEDAPEYGCTCHYMDDGFDTGDLLKVARFPIDASQETAVSLERKAQREMIRVCHEFIDMAESGHPLPREQQNPGDMRYMKREEFEALKRIPPDSDAATIDRYARAFWYPPYECAYTCLGQSKVDVIPQIAKDHVAHLLQADAVDDLMSAVADASD